MSKKLALWLASMFLWVSHLPVQVWAETPPLELADLKAKIEILEKQVDESLKKDNESVAATDKLGLRNHPVPLGKAIRIEQKDLGEKGSIVATYHLKIEELKRGEEATQILDTLANYSAIPNDQEWVVMKLHLDYLEGDENIPLTTYTHYSLFDKGGKEIRKNYEYYATIDDRDAFEGQSMFPPNEHSGYIAFVVPKESEFLFAYDTIERKYFFSTQQNVSESTQKLMDELAQLKEAYKEKAQKLWGSKEYPVPLGETITIEEAVTTTDDREITVKYSYRIVDIARGEDAHALMRQWAPDAPVLSHDKEWVFLVMEMTYLEDYSNTPFFSIASTRIQTESGVVVPQTEHYLLKDFGFTHLQKNATAQAAIAFQIPKGESFQFIYDVELERYYFDGQK